MARVYKKGIHLSPNTEFKRGIIPWNKKPFVKIICLFCKKESFHPPSIAKLRKYCSNFCKNSVLIGKAPWNKWLTKETDNRVKKCAEAIPLWKRILHGKKYGFKLKHPYFDHKSGCGCFMCSPINEHNHATFGGLNEETKLKISKTHSINMNGKGKRNSPLTEFTSERMKGEKNPNWRGGITPIHLKIRTGPEYRSWRKAVFSRDRYICQICKVKGGDLQADHIKQFAFYPELRFKISNGRTLCKNCHKQTDSYGVKGMYRYMLEHSSKNLLDLLEKNPFGKLRTDHIFSNFNKRQVILELEAIYEMIPGWINSVKKMKELPRAVVDV